MKALKIRLSLLFSISMLLVSCGSSQQHKNEPSLQVAPSPITSPGTDSLKQNLDAERERRKKKAGEF